MCCAAVQCEPYVLTVAALSFCRTQTNKLAGLEDSNVEQAISRAQAFLAEIADSLGKSKTGWILDTPEPTALDGHVVVFVCRVQDVRRASLIPPEVETYAATAIGQEAWKATMNGRRTVPTGGF